MAEKKDDDSNARAERLHELIDQLTADRTAGEKPGTAPAAPGGTSLRDAVHRRMRELDESASGCGESVPERDESAAERDESAAGQDESAAERDESVAERDEPASDHDA
ncbi:hypothetical protein DY245_02140 [Streptomyces inhibens]|uniref:Uncharacterized protein n=1 Tax=Streptomyces inhibens TaxID=2293571 RepID=A0A371QB33_STRIH|nr:hypothetical protein [Streptomyces inhibens]REK91868.1 hypothetical protein DY245_02140 [Streptomyces inhibens]